MIYTSYFAAMRRMTNEQKSRCVCIALWPPKGVSIPIYSNLAPTKKILLDYKKNMWKPEVILFMRQLLRQTV